jgi:hypothetical protein
MSNKKKRTTKRKNKSKNRTGAKKGANKRPRNKAKQKSLPCQQKKIKGRFDKVEVKCGSPVGFEADATNIADGKMAKFQLCLLPRQKTVLTVKRPLKTSKVRGLNWISKKLSNSWPAKELDFRVSADDVSSRSENQLKFHRYSNQASETKTFNCASGIYGWTGKFDVEFKNGLLIITIKIKLVNRKGNKPAGTAAALPAVGPAVSKKVKQNMKRDIQSKLTGKWLLHRGQCQRAEKCKCPIKRKCCKFRVRINVQFVEAGQHHTVNLFRGKSSANSNNWTRIKLRKNSWAHETGHLLGWYDEYATGATGSPPRWKSVRAGAVMNTGLKVPAEYYWDFRDWYKGKTGEDWKLVKK